MASDKILVNRAPVLTLWAAVVAERLGYGHDTALTLGKAVAGLNAQSKGRRIGIYPQPKGDMTERKEARAEAEEEEEAEEIQLLQRVVPAVHTADGLRAVNHGDAIKPETVERYLEKKFGDDLEPARKAMEKLALSYPPKKLAVRAFELYEHFRPKVPEGKAGWGAAGELDLDAIRKLAVEEAA